MRKSLYVQHKEKWLGCDRCLLSEHRKRVVLCRGKLPCDVLVVGEAPGQSEDVLGSPFVGPAGQLLDSMIERCNGGEGHILQTPKGCNCGGDTGYCPICDGGLGYCVRCRKGESELDQPCVKVRWAWTNLVGCIPNDASLTKYDVPKEAIKACRPRLVELCTIAKPKLIVQAGTLSASHWNAKLWQKLLPETPEPKWVKIDHPARILRSNVVDRNWMIQRCEAVLSDALLDAFGG